MSKLRLVFLSGLILISYYSIAQENKTLDSLRSLVQEIAGDSSTHGSAELEVIQQYLNQAKQAQQQEDIIFGYQQMAALNYQLGRTNQALHYYKLYVIELEHLSDYETFRQQRFEKNLYENEIKALNNKISLLEKQNEELLSARGEFLELNYWIYLGLKTALILAGLLFISWLYLKFRKPKKKQDIEEPAYTSPTLAEIIATTKNQLTKAETELDLSDILVQQMITQPEDYFLANKSIRKKFLIHQPKKLAGGAGLYMSSARGKTIMAVFDAPGFGAAGGLLSLQIYNLTEDLVKNHHIMLPSLMLNQLEINLRNLFPAGVPFTEGIKIAICLYDASLRKLSFAGAKMDLFIVQNGRHDKLLGVSKSLLEENQNIGYADTEIDSLRKKNFYLSTSGFWQQVGGHDHKPFGQAAFEKAIESLSSQPISDHEQVLSKILNDWRGGNEQNEDILVFGFSF
jgi:Stage II sporulation protein E (SpoIIE)